MNKQLTIQEAKKEGYKYACLEFGEGQLIPLDECEPLKRYVLVAKVGRPFTIPDNLIKELVCDYLCNQEDVSDEDGHLNDLAEKVDYADITKKINEAFSTTSYFYAANIKLII